MRSTLSEGGRGGAPSQREAKGGREEHPDRGGQRRSSTQSEREAKEEHPVREGGKGRAPCQRGQRRST